MGVGLSILLVAIGAVLTFALERSVEGIDLDTVGIILMIVGTFGLLFSGVILGNGREPRE